MPARLIHCAVAAGLTLLRLALPAAAQDRAVDETALRYYAANGQSGRAEAEGKRLAALHPGWSVPPDVWTARPGQADEKPLWAMFAADDIDGLKQAMARRRQAQPGWQPSEDLARKLGRKELRRAVLARTGSGQWLAAADLARDFGKTSDFGKSSQLDVADVELAWLVAEAFARSDRQAEALTIYRTILSRRSDPKERSATIQKAIALLPMSDVEPLLALGRDAGNGTPEFAALALDITRGRIGAILHEERKAPIEQPEMAAFEGHVRQAGDAGDAGLVAWLALKQDRAGEALGWFKLAISRGGDAMIAHGLAHTLLRLGQRREAEEVAFAWREPLVNNAILFIDVLESELTKPAAAAIEPERLARYAKVTLDTRSGEGAQALGWYAYNACQFETSLDWFQRAGAWLPKEATIFGQALSLQRLKRQREAIELINRYDGLFPKLVGLLFRDGREDRQGPCDPRTMAQRPRAAPDGAIFGAGLAVRVPQPGEALRPGLTAANAVRRTDFPIAVAPENPLRFPASGSVQGGAGPGGFRPRGQETRPLVARRVGGVVAMPYEPLGFALLPGWNGLDAASDMPGVDRPPAGGTLWAQAQARPQIAGPAPSDANAGAADATRFRR